ncbi:MAG: prolyl oligopeptidase family serine peptidase, partial [Planctomycetaceae bacterium]|nr:prolyl oligopeptidase family serine peptidase [Planctomycetaceae bacterium]
MKSTLTSVRAGLLCGLLVCIPNSVRADGAEIIPATALVVEGLQAEAGQQLPADPVQVLLARRGSEPLNINDGDKIQGFDQSELTWKSVALNAQGGLEKAGSQKRGGYAYVVINSDSERTMILNASGHQFAYWNGEPRGSDTYGDGIGHFPVRLRKGSNELLLRLSWRGRMKIRLYDPPQPLFFPGADMTAPHLVIDEPIDTWVGIIAVNATSQPMNGLTVTTTGAALSPTGTPVPAIPPMTMRKIGCRVSGPAPSSEAGVKVNVRLSGAGLELQPSNSFQLQPRTRDQVLKQTFVSDIDGSVQYYGLKQAVPQSPEEGPPAIALSCHGASVQAIRQAGAYSKKSWIHMVAPTNRRPFGFDWEDFGRADAMEVLQLAQSKLKHDPSRIYLTGHSMGGHGTWHIGVTYPDRFAAIGPSAGWVSYKLYRMQDDANREVEPSPLDEIIRRGNIASDTIALSPNLKHQGVYILHGAKDDNVPPSHARLMAKTLQEFHHDWRYHEEPDKNHWWTNELKDGGAACLDWPEMYDMFARHTLPPAGAIREVEFVTANPGVSAKCNWLSIDAQIHQQKLSRVKVMTYPNGGRFEGTTDNVRVLRLETSHLRNEGPLKVTLDGQELKDIARPENHGSIWLERDGDKWAVISQPGLQIKGPHRYGSVKSELRHRFLFVYGTAGNDETDAWVYSKARFDSETFWYRGNASVEFIADTQFDAAATKDRTVVLYGNADNNSAWNALLGSSPIQVRDGSITVGEKTFKGDDL